MSTHKLPAQVLLLVLLCFALAHTLTAAIYNYAGNGLSGTGLGCIGQSTLTLSDSGSTIRGSINLGDPIGRYYQDYLVLYIDSKPGGFGSTASFADVNNQWTRSISGYNGGTGRATANFAPNFAADYAIILSRTGPVGALYELASGTEMGPYKNISFTDNGTSWQFSFALGDIGASEPSFKFQSTSVSSVGSGFRYLDSYESLTGNYGFNTVTFGNYNTFGVPAVPETTNAALMVFGGLVLSAAIGSRLRRHFAAKA